MVRRRRQKGRLSLAFFGQQQGKEVCNGTLEAAFVLLVVPI